MRELFETEAMKKFTPGVQASPMSWSFFLLFSCNKYSCEFILLGVSVFLEFVFTSIAHLCYYSNSLISLLVSSLVTLEFTPTCQPECSHRPASHRWHTAVYPTAMAPSCPKPSIAIFVKFKLLTGPTALCKIFPKTVTVKDNESSLWYFYYPF